MKPLTTRASAIGLDDIVVAHTALSDVNGSAGNLTVVGHPVAELAGSLALPHAIALLFTAGGNPSDEAAVSASLHSGAQSWSTQPSHSLPPNADAMEALRFGLASLVSTGNDGGDALRAIAVAPLVVARWLGCTPTSHSTAANDGEYWFEGKILRSFGISDDRARRRALATYLVTVMDHGLNASTFTARVVASTGADMNSALLAAIGALKGPLHGGAPGPVLDMLDSIGEPDNAQRWIDTELAAGRRIMGMGHRIYTVRDPRAEVFERAIRELQANGVAAPRMALAREVEAIAKESLRKHKPDRQLHANVEFYTAVLLDSIGFDRRVFSTVFAFGRIAGWAAHVIEQRRVGRLIRPKSTYVGATASHTT